MGFADMRGVVFDMGGNAALFMYIRYVGRYVWTYLMYGCYGI